MKLPSEKDYPKEIKIGTETYTVEFVSKIKGESKDTVGLCEDDPKRITIKRGQTKKEIFSTFIHEVLHSIENEYKIDLVHKDVYKLEKALVDFFRKNF